MAWLMKQSLITKFVSLLSGGTRAWDGRIEIRNSYMKCNELQYESQ